MTGGMVWRRFKKPVCVEHIYACSSPTNYMRLNIRSPVAPRERERDSEIKKLELQRYKSSIKKGIVKIY